MIFFRCDVKPSAWYLLTPLVLTQDGRLRHRELKHVAHGNDFSMRNLFTLNQRMNWTMSPLLMTSPRGMH